MTLLDRLRRWLFGAGDTKSSSTESTDESAADETTDSRLDPDNVTQTRSKSDDDAVSQLQEIKGEQVDGEGSESRRE